MQTLRQEIDQSQQGLTTNQPALNELTPSQVAAYIQEVSVLRQRVVDLEAELAAIKATQVTQSSVREAPPLTAIDFTPPCPPDPKTAIAVAPAPIATSVSQFTAPKAPAVAPVSNPGFAEAWNAEDEEASAEEDSAAEAFFSATSVDEESRNWLLG